MGHVNLCIWCGLREVGTEGGLLDYCSPECESDCLSELDGGSDPTFGVRDEDEHLLQIRYESESDEWMSQFDDDPSPYSGTYSEE